MKKILILLGVFFLYFFVTIYIVPYFLPAEEVKKMLVSGLKQATGAEPVLLGEAKLIHFPFPKYSIPGIKIKNQAGFEAEDFFSSGEVVIRPGIISLMAFTPKIGKIIINNPVFSLEVKPQGETNLGNLFLKNANAEPDKFPEIVFLLGKIIMQNQNGVEEVVLSAGDIKASLEKDKIISIAADFGPKEKGIKLEGALGKFDKQADALPLNFTLKANDAKFTLNGSLERPENNPEFKGKIAASVGAFARTLNNYLNLAVKIPDKIYDQGLALEGDGTFNMKAISIASASAGLGAFKGTGALEVNFGAKPAIGVELNIENVDLDALETAMAKSKDKKTENIKDLPPPSPDNPLPPPVPEEEKEEPAKDEKSKNAESQGNPDLVALLPDNIFFSVMLNINNVIYKKQTLPKVELTAGLSKELQEITALNVTLPGNSKIELSALPSADETGKGRQMNGHVKIYGDNLHDAVEFVRTLGIDIPPVKLENYFLESDYVYSGNKIYFPNLDVLLADAALNGKFLIDNDDKKFEAIVQGSNFNIDHIINAIEFPRAAAGGGQDITVFDNLRTLPYKLRAAFTLDELTYADNVFKKAGGEFEIAGGILTSNLEAETDAFGRISTQIKIDAQNFKPSFAGNFACDKLSLANLVNFRSRFEDLIYIGRTKPQAMTPKFDVPTENANWPVEPISFSGVNFLDAELDLDIKSFMLGNLDFKNLTTKIKMQDGTLGLEDLKSNLFGGNFDLRSNIGTRGRPAASVSFALSGADLGEAAKLLTGKNFAAGKFGVSGSLSFSGFNVNDWMGQASGSGTIVAKGINLSGFDLKQVYERLSFMTTPNSYNNLMSNAFSSGNTLFDGASGNVFFNEGIAELRNIEMKSAYINKGTLNAKMNLRTLYAQAEMDIGALTPAARSIPISVTARGPIDNMQVIWDYSAFRSYWDNIMLQKTKNQ